MVQGYYTLQEAADVLDMSVDDLKGLAQKSQIRSFQDRGTLRFRIQDIQELQRQRLGASDPEMVLGDAVSSKPPSGGAPKSGVIRSPKPKPADVFDFELDDSADIGSDSPAASGPRSKPGGSKSAPKSGPRTPKQGSDSDVKLVAEDSENFSVQLGADPVPGAGDSDVRLGDLPPKRGSGSSRKSGATRRSDRIGQSPEDSGVRLVPMESDSGVRLDAGDPAASESGVRLEQIGGERDLSNTEEINLDEEIKKHEAAARKQAETKFKSPSKVGKQPSPFELSDHDVAESPPPKRLDDSSDFEIAAHGSGGPKTPKSASRSPKPGKKKATEFEMIPSAESDEDFSLQLSDDSVDLGADHSAEFEGPQSGINLSRPSDKGISLEAPKSGKNQGGDFEFDLSPGPATPKPSKETDSDSEFELSLDDSSSETTALHDSADSEFELSLDDGSADGGSSVDEDSATEAGQDSSGDFELTLDAPEEEQKPKAKSKAKKKDPDTDEQDIFETDFELPALDGEAEPGDETADSGSSDFELALDDSDISVDDESGSQVVALDEEEGDVGEETREGDEDDFGEGDIEEEVDEDEEEAPVREKVVVQEVVRDRWVKPAPWGVLPVALLTPALIVMVLTGIIGWELLQSSSGFKNSGVLTKNLGEMMGLKVR